MNQFRRVGWMTMWAATVLAFVLSFDQPAATYAMALRPASDTRNYLGLPWPVPEARKWTLVVAGVAFVAVILVAGAQSLLVRRWVSPRRWLAVTVVGAAGAIVVDVLFVCSGASAPEAWREHAGLAAGAVVLFCSQLVALPRDARRGTWAAVQIVAAVALALPFVPTPPSIASAVVCTAAGFFSARLLSNTVPVRAGNVNRTELAH